MASMFSQFETSEKLESQGIWVDYGDFRVRLAHTGGANKKFISMMEAETKPYRRLIQNNAMDENRTKGIYYKVFATTAVLAWEVKTGENEDGSTIWSPGIHRKDGSVMEPTVQNIIATFNALPNLLQDLKQTADNTSLYRAEGLEEDAKN